MKDHAAAIVSHEAFTKRAERWPESTPDTKEAYYIRDIFDSALLKRCTGRTDLSQILF
jgi:asparagine synthase (glutamine-hydrolysing)